MDASDSAGQTTRPPRAEALAVSLHATQRDELRAHARLHEELG